MRNVGASDELEEVETLRQEKVDLESVVLKKDLFIN